MKASIINKIFKHEKDCHAFVSDHNDGWTFVKQIDAMSKESFNRAIEEILKVLKKENLKKE